MRKIHRKKIADQLTAYGFHLREFTTETNNNEFTIFSVYKKELFFSFRQSKLDPENYSYRYSRYNYEFSIEDKSSIQGFDTIFGIFTNWIGQHLKPFHEDQTIDDPFEIANISSFHQFTESASSIEDKNKLSQDEQNNFRKGVLQLQSYIEGRLSLQAEEIKELKASIESLIDLSKKETKGTLKKEFIKVLNSIVTKGLVEVIIQGGKLVFNIFNQGSIPMIESGQQWIA